MKQHLKSIAAPKSWILPRIRGKFTLRPRPSGHPIRAGLPLGLLLRDTLHLAATMAEVRKLLSTREVLVDGRRRQDHRFLVGLFDILAIPLLKKQYRVLLDEKGRIKLKEISAAEAALKLCKVIGKTVITGGKVQYHFHDGKNIIMEKQEERPPQHVAVGDTLLVTLPALMVKQVLTFAPQARIFLVGGRHQGSSGTVREIKGAQVSYATAAGQNIETAKEYAFVIGAAGEKAGMITL